MAFTGSVYWLPRTVFSLENTNDYPENSKSGGLTISDFFALKKKGYMYLSWQTYYPQLGKYGSITEYYREK